MRTIVAMSDTHGRHHNLEVPDGDILIHAGDFCKYGSRANVDEFAEWFSAFPHKHKIVIAGNHDTALQKYRGYSMIFGLYPENGHINFLEDSEVTVAGLKFWGSPFTPPFQSWAFMLPEEQLARKYALIPDDVDVLITHGPPANVLDFTDLEGVAAGSYSLAYRIGEIMTARTVEENTKPLIHVFGHIHERHGHFESEDGRYQAYNMAICDFKYNPVNPCTVIEVP